MSVPSDHDMLLRLIDARFETMAAKIDALTITINRQSELFDKYDARLDGHEHRLSDIEAQMVGRQRDLADYALTKQRIEGQGDSIVELQRWQTEAQTTTRNAGKWGAAIWGAFGSAITAALMFFATSYFQAQPSVHQPVHKVSLLETSTRFSPRTYVV